MRNTTLLKSEKYVLKTLYVISLLKLFFSWKVIFNSYGLKNVVLRFQPISEISLFFF